MAFGGFRKRTFTWRSLAASLVEIFAHRKEMRAALQTRRIDRAFAEKIMLAVTQVNDCRYCSTFHAGQALKAGVTEEEVHRLLAGELGHFPPDQLAALAFARHYAEREGRPHPQAMRELVEFYGPDKAADILVFIRMISFGNLLGNTFDLFLYTLRTGPQTSLDKCLARLSPVNKDE